MSRKLKRLASKADGIVTFDVLLEAPDAPPPTSVFEITVPDNVKDWAYCPVMVYYEGKGHEIRANRCINAFCKWFGLDQETFRISRTRPHQKTVLHRYNLGGSKLSCCADPIGKGSGVAITTDKIEVMSNWSIALEIQRLATQGRVVDLKPEYNFHTPDCPNHRLNPFDNPEAFYRRGSSSANSPRFTCRTCGKWTNTRPDRITNFTYRQKRNDILIDFAEHLVNKTGVQRMCDLLRIGASTYYTKLDWLHRCCMDFLDKYERPAFKSRTFDEMWLSTDGLVFRLRNVRKHGKGRGKIRFGDEELDELEGEDEEEYEDEDDDSKGKTPFLKTQVIVTADVKSRYIFRADINFDSEARLEDIEAQSKQLGKKGLRTYALKNGRYGIFAYIPTVPRGVMTKKQREARELVQTRKRYLDGLHVVPSYTAFASYFLIKQTVNAKEWRLVSDADSSLTGALKRVFTEEIAQGRAHHFICRVRRKQSAREAYVQFRESREELREWVKRKRLVLNEASLWENIGNEPAGKQEGKVTWVEAAKGKLRDELAQGAIYEFVTVDGEQRPVGYLPFDHPLPGKDEGTREVSCTTILRTTDPEKLAEMFLSVNTRATDSFFAMMHRRLSALERPILGARARARAYIYTAVKPDVAQKMVDILRVYRNWMMPVGRIKHVTGPDGKRIKVGKRLTPAQRLGLTDKVFTWRDIVYLR